MSQVVQARCPHCRNVLRIPEEWLSKSMRCKHCKKTFQAKAKTSSSMSANVPVAKPATAAHVAQADNAVRVGRHVRFTPKQPSNNPFGFVESEPPASTH